MPRKKEKKQSKNLKKNNHDNTSNHNYCKYHRIINTK